MLDIARNYIRLGMKVMPVPRGSKAPVIKGWQSLRLTPEQLPEYFTTNQAWNVGVLMGEPSNWLIDVDLDHSRARARADEFLPVTPAVFGRASNPRSHRIYRVTGPIDTKKFRSKGHGMIVEIRSTGTQTLFPPSVHPCGEDCRWEDAAGVPTEIDPATLYWAVEQLADAVLAEFGEKRQTANTPGEGANKQSDPLPKRRQACLDAMARMQVADENDGSHRLFAAACRTVEFDLDEENGLELIRTYANRCPFPREWTDEEIIQRIRDAEGHVTRGAASEPKVIRGQSQATMAVELCDQVDLFHDDDVAYATLKVKGRTETVRLRSRHFQTWLSHACFERRGTVPGSQALSDAIGTLEGKARFEGPQLKVHVRLAEHAGAIYLDLADSERRIVQVTPAGWDVVTDAPVRFRRPKALLQLPVPSRGGSVNLLREFINLDRDADFILLVAWLLAALRPGWPLPILIFTSEQGSGKSTASRLLRLLIDPNEAPIRCQPRDPRELMITASHSLVLALDNLSDLQIWLSDALCRLSTGGGFSARALYENDEEVIFNALRPIILNGIEDVGGRSDLLDRAIRVSLPSIPETKRQTEQAIYAKFEIARPLIMGALFDAVAAALVNRESVDLGRYPRMADFAKWIVAAEPSLPWAPGSFMAAFDENRAGAHELAIEASPVGEAVYRFAQRKTEWAGKASELLAALGDITEETVRSQQGWPKKPNQLTGALKRIAPNLRAMGVDVDFSRTGKQRTVSIRTVSQTSVTSVIDRHHAVSGNGNRGDDDDAATLCDGAVTIPEGCEMLHVTVSDDDDAPLQHSSDDDLMERMALMEFEGGLSRERAESRARQLHHHGHLAEVA